MNAFTYQSTRGGAPACGFEDALLAGLAPDGGLYVPDVWPSLGAIETLRGRPFAEIAFAVADPFVGDFDRSALMTAIEGAYASFAHPATAPLTQIGPEDFILELHHGPTLAFKDVAMQLLGRLFEHVLAQSGRKLTIIGATSGDTGGAAIEALRDRVGVDVVMLHPEGRISDVQRKLMTTVEAGNIANVAVDGTFDDCQRIVKTLFADEALRQEAGLSAVNSINWARIMAQASYYVSASLALAGGPVNFAVPTGNFGDALAGWVAKKMGAPVGRILVATNENDILDRALTTGRYQPGTAEATIAPAMDIQVASNFERALFEAADRDAAWVRAAMAALPGEGFDIPDMALSKLREDFLSARIDRTETEATMRRVLAETRELLCPHSAIGVAAATRLRAQGALEGPVVSLATAHAAKFPEAVAATTGVKPELPERYRDLYELPERIERLPASPDAVAAFVRQRIAR